MSADKPPFEPLHYELRRAGLGVGIPLGQWRQSRFSRADQPASRHDRQNCLICLLGNFAY